MIKSRRNFFLGIFIFLIPYLGLPSSWKTMLVMLSGILIVAFSVKFAIPKKMPKRIRRKEKVTPVFVENSPIYPSEKSVNQESQNAGESQGTIQDILRQ